MAPIVLKLSDVFSARNGNGPLHFAAVCTQPFRCSQRHTDGTLTTGHRACARTIGCVSVWSPMRFSATHGGSCHDMIVGKTATPSAPATQPQVGE